MFSGPSRPRSDARHLAGDGRPAETGDRPQAAPRHRAPTAGRHLPHEPLLARRAARGARALPIDVPLEPEELEVTPVTRVHRSRLAFAVAVTLAAVPVLVVDNLSATAEPNQARVEVTASSAEASSSSSEPSTTVTTAAPAPTTTEAPATTAAAPSETTEAPPTTAAVVVAQAIRAPAPTVPPTTVAPPTTSPPTTVAPVPYGDPSDPATWERLAQCESGGNWSMNAGNGYYGGLQFSVATWRNVGGSGYPHQATKAEQIKRGKILQARAGWGQWPHCANALGYR